MVSTPDEPFDEDEDPDQEIFRYGRKVIAVHWAVVIAFFVLIWTGILLMRDWFLVTFNIFGGDLWFETFDGAMELHIASGVTICLLGLIHILLHVRQEEKPILPKNVASDFKATFETAMWVTFISRNRESGSSDKYMANQRMSYLAIFYTLSLSAISATFIGIFGATGSAVHVVAGTLVGLLAAFRILYLLRTRERLVWRSILSTGTMPLWYIKENYYNWYLELKGIDPEEITEGPKEAEPEPEAPKAAPAAD
ncbi:MAG: cytochrome b/b6 domain-containing protein [Thermoplasmata archaeon]|nr:MAG: cytochrome b/b6 domain-containing protein [Thermoplasmata archaeon]